MVLSSFSPMEVTLLGSFSAFSPVSSERRLSNAVFSSSKSNPRRRTHRVTAVKSVALKTHVGGRRLRKYENGAATVAEVVENPYSGAETASPDLHKSLSDFLEEARDLVGDDDGPPRWFSPLECSSQAQGSPLLLFIPGIDGTGLGLIRHHKKLGECVTSNSSFLYNLATSRTWVFDVWCLHIPVMDRSPAKATHVNNLMSQPLVGMLNVLPDGVPTLLGEIFGFKQGDPLTAVLGGGILRDLFAVSANLPTLSRIFPKDTLLWKMELVKSAVASANTHIHAVRAETLILLSGRDQWLLNEADIDRFARTLPNFIVRKLKDNGHFLFFEDSVDLVTIIKCTCFYRRGKSHDHISDYIMLTSYELKQLVDDHKLLIDATSPVYLSTLANGKRVRGLEGIPSEGPVLYVGYHVLLGLEIVPVITQFLKERNIHLRGLAHPMLMWNIQDDRLVDPQMLDKYKMLGGVPVSNFNIYKLLQSKSHALLYPGGIRESFHRKGEEYKLFWPEQPEFVRVASKFGAKIVPFGVVGEDDICHLVLDAKDQRNIPILKDFMDYIEEATKQAGNLREGDGTELGNQICYLPGLVPKIPGRFYFYFGKPIETAGKEQELKDKDKAQEFYLQVKSEVEQCIAYLKMKRESDPYRHLLPRMLYQASHGFSSEIPTFDL
ncbi:hypothetical protein Bca101_051425 [Brassica carinata]